MKTFQYTCYFGRDTEDWVFERVQATDVEDATRKAEASMGLHWSLLRNSVKEVVDP